MDHRVKPGGDEKKPVIASEAIQRFAGWAGRSEAHADIPKKARSRRSAP